MQKTPDYNVRARDRWVLDAAEEALRPVLRRALEAGYEDWDLKRMWWDNTGAMLARIFHGAPPCPPPTVWNDNPVGG